MNSLLKPVLIVIFCMCANIMFAQTITSFSPSLACSGATVTITGTGFTGATAVKFGGVNAASFTVNSPTSITAVTGPGSTGLVTVTTPAGTGTSSSKFIFGTTANVYAYIPNTGSRTVSVVNTATSTVVATIALSSVPAAVAISPDGTRAYIANTTYVGNGGTLTVINTLSNTVISTIAAGGTTAVVSPDNSKVYLAGGNGISIISTATNTVIGTIPGVSGAGGMAVIPDGSKIYAVNFLADMVSVINTATNTVTGTITVGTAPSDLVFSPDGSKLYVANAGGSVSVINTALNTVSSTITGVSQPRNIALSPDGSKLYLTDPLVNNNINEINLATNAVTPIAAGDEPAGLSFNPDGSKLYVVSRRTQQLLVLNTTTNTVVDSVTVGFSPYAFGNFIATAVTPCTPAIASFTPASACPGSSVTIKGTNFIGVTSVNFGGTGAATFHVDSDTSITAVLGTGASGPIAVVTAGGTATSSSSLTMLTTCATITSFTPALISCSGTTVTITGTKFTGATAVAFGGVNASSFTVNSATSITATTGANTPLTGVVTVTKPANTAVSSSTFITGDISGTPFAYIPNYGSNNVSVVNTASNTIVATIAVGNGPAAVAAPTTGSYVYVANTLSNNVSVINTITGTIVATIPVGTAPAGIAFNPGGSKVYVVNSGSNNVSVITTVTNTVSATIHVGGNPFGVAFSPDGSFVYVTNQADNTVSVITAASNTVTNTIPVGKTPLCLAVSPDGKHVYVADKSSSKISIINTLNNKVASVAVGFSPYGVAVSPDGSQVYVTNSINSSIISVINTATNTVTGNITTAFNPTGISITPDGAYLYVSSPFFNNLTVISLATNRAIATLPLGTQTGGIGGFIGNVAVPCVPTITSFTPSSVCTGNTVTITGTNFTNASAVTFGSEKAAYFTVVSPTTITATAGRGNPGRVAVTTPGGTATSAASITASGVPGFTITPNPLYLSDGEPRAVSIGLPAAYALSCTNGQTDTSAIIISSPGTYTVTAKDSAGCTDTASVTAVAYTKRGGYLELVADPFVNYFDTIHVRVNIHTGVNLFSAYAHLNFDNSRLRFVDAAPGSYFGTHVTITPPVVNRSVITFGMTKIAGQPATDGDGVLYDFRFVLNRIPDVAYDSVNPNNFITGFNLTSLSIHNKANVQPRSFTQISLLHASTYCRYYVPVWPGDVNNDSKIDVSDVLPIGYFAHIAGPLRPNASLLWKPQPAILWGLFNIPIKTQPDETVANAYSSTYETFADANGDGYIDASDTVAIGLHLAAPYHAPVPDFLPSTPAINLSMPNDVIGLGILPHTEPVKVFAGSEALPVRKLYGAAFDVYFDTAFIDIAAITTDYTESRLGTEGVDFIKMEDRSALSHGRLSIGITRTNSADLFADGKLLLKINMPFKAGAPRGKFKIMVIPISVNDNRGNILDVTGSADSLTIGTQTKPAVTALGAVANGAQSQLQDGKFDGVIFPNPAGSTAKLLTSGAKGNVLVTITDLTGKAVVKMEINGNATTSLPVSSLAAGVYIVTISDGKQSKALKLVKMK